MRPFHLGPTPAGQCCHIPRTSAVLLEFHARLGIASGFTRTSFVRNALWQTRRARIGIPPGDRMASRLLSDECGRLVHFRDATPGQSAFDTAADHRQAFGNTAPPRQKAGFLIKRGYGAAADGEKSSAAGPEPLSISLHKERTARLLQPVTAPLSAVRRPEFSSCIMHSLAAHSVRMQAAA